MRGDTSGEQKASILDLHSQALLVLALWVQGKEEEYFAWKDVTKNFYDVLFGSEAGKISKALNIDGDADLLTEIAYTALGSLSNTDAFLPFGSPVIASLFADANKLGQMADDGFFSKKRIGLQNPDSNLLLKGTCFQRRLWKR